jgi:hypothetical protein
MGSECYLGIGALRALRAFVVNQLGAVGTGSVVLCGLRASVVKERGGGKAGREPCPLA